jgi:hypothetical protein
MWQQLQDAGVSIVPKSNLSEVGKVQHSPVLLDRQTSSSAQPSAGPCHPALVGGVTWRGAVGDAAASTVKLTETTSGGGSCWNKTAGTATQTGKVSAGQSQI